MKVLAAHLIREFDYSDIAMHDLPTDSEPDLIVKKEVAPERFEMIDVRLLPFFRADLNQWVCVIRSTASISMANTRVSSRLTAMPQVRWPSFYALTWSKLTRALPRHFRYTHSRQGVRLLPCSTQQRLDFQTRRILYTSSFGAHANI